MDETHHCTMGNLLDTRVSNSQLSLVYFPLLFELSLKSHIFLDFLLRNIGEDNNFFFLNLFIYASITILLISPKTYQNLSLFYFNIGIIYCPKYSLCDCSNPCYHKTMTTLRVGSVSVNIFLCVPMYHSGLIVIIIIVKDH